MMNAIVKSTKFGESIAMKYMLANNSTACLNLWFNP